MRVPRVRLSLRSMMFIVALSASLAGGAVLVQRASESAQLERCRTNLLSIGLGVQNYVSAHGSFPAGTVANDRLPPARRLGWLVVIWGFIEQLYWIFNMSEPWDSETNRVTRCRGIAEEPHATGRIASLCCPAAAKSSDEHMPGWTWYVGIAGVGADSPTLPEGHRRAGIFGYERQTSLGGIKDGASQTLLLVETGLANGPWTAGGPATIRGLDPGRQPYIGRDRQFGGMHRQGVMVAMADGSVRLLSETIDPKILEALATVAGGEALPVGWDR